MRNGAYRTTSELWVMMSSIHPTIPPVVHVQAHQGYSVVDVAIAYAVSDLAEVRNNL
jgi:hypothetical protein